MHPFLHHRAVEPLNQFKRDQFCTKTLQYQSCFRPRATTTDLSEWFDSLGTVENKVEVVVWFIACANA